MRQRHPQHRRPSGGQQASARDARAEPVLGDIDEVAAAPARRRGHGGHRGHRGRGLSHVAGRWWWLALLVLLALLAGLALRYRQPLVERFWPQPHIQVLHDQAETALAQGRLSAADGSGARELFEAILALDPDRRQAREGLARVGQAALGKAREATEQGRFDAAHRDLRLAQALAVPRAQSDAVAEALRVREVAATGIGQLLAQAAAARAAGRLDGATDAALPIYQRVLALQPDHDEALQGRDAAVADLLDLAARAVRQGELALAADRIDRARDYAPGHVDLIDIQAGLLDAIEARRQQAEHALRNGRLEAALEDFRVLLAVDPDDRQAQQGIAQVAAAWAQRAEGFAADFRFAPAEQALRQARAIAPDSAAVRKVAARVSELRRSQTTLAPAPGSERSQASLQALLAQARAALARGELMAPPGASAFDKLHAAQAISASDPAVRQVAQELLQAARDCFDQALSGNGLTRAGNCLRMQIQLGEERAALKAERTRLALRWIAYGDERLGANDLTSARHALKSARGLDPEAPGLIEFGQRVARATAVLE